MALTDPLDSLNPSDKNKVPFLRSVCELACKNTGWPAKSDQLALVSEVQRIVHKDMWDTERLLILYILKEYTDPVDRNRPAPTSPSNLHQPSLLPTTRRPPQGLSHPAYSPQQRQEPHEDAISVVSDRSSTLPDGSLPLEFKNSGSLSDSAMWSFSLQNPIHIACVEGLSDNNIIRSSIADRAGLQIDELDEDDYPIITNDSHLPWAKQDSFQGKTLIEWRPAGCWRTISTEVYVTDHRGAPDMSVGKALMIKVAEHRKSLENSLSHISHHKRQKKTELSRFHHINEIQARSVSNSGQMLDRSFDRYETYTQSQQLPIPDNIRQNSIEMGRNSTLHSDSGFSQYHFQNSQLLYPDHSAPSQSSPSVQDMPVQTIPSLTTRSLPQPGSLTQKEKTSSKWSGLLEEVRHSLSQLVSNIFVSVIVFWALNRTSTGATTGSLPKVSEP